MGMRRYSFPSPPLTHPGTFSESSKKDASWDIHLKKKKFPSRQLQLTAGSGPTSLGLVTAS